MKRAILKDRPFHLTGTYANIPVTKQAIANNAINPARHINMIRAVLANFSRSLSIFVTLHNFFLAKIHQLHTTSNKFPIYRCAP